MTAHIIHPSDVDGFIDHLSREALLAAYEQGDALIHYIFRCLSQGEYRWTEATAILYTNENGDLCDFTLVRWADERADELEQLWLKKVLELAVVSSFEYICLINVNSGEYFLYGDQENTRAVPRKGSFDEVTREIRDQFIPVGEQEAYYESARIDRLPARMEEGGGSYSYCYRLPDGLRQASFHWFEPSHTQLLMTVQRLP